MPIIRRFSKAKLLQIRKYCIVRRRQLALISSTYSALAACIYQYNHSQPLGRQHDGAQTGEMWMQELLAGHPTRIKNNLGLSQEGFFELELMLKTQSCLQATRNMSTTEQLGIFLYAVVTDLSMRKLAERFQRSTESIQRTYHKVMKLFLYKPFFITIIKSADDDTPLTDYIADRTDFYPYFKNAVGAIDGTHIPVSPSAEDRPKYRDRSNGISQNVLAACDFNMKFTDVLSGWEGSAADSMLWREAIRCGSLFIPEGKFMLGDAGFPSCDLCLVPYKGVRYHLQEWNKGKTRPRTREELFNLRHARARNIIERIFGVMKNKFKILTKPRAFKMKAQARCVTALCCLYNIMVDFQELDQLDEDWIAPVVLLEDGDIIHEASGEGYYVTRRDKRNADKRRDEIAQQMWDDYEAR